MNLQLDQFLFILRIVLVALIYLFLIQLIFIVRRDIVRMGAGAGSARAGTTTRKGAGYLVVVKPGPMPLRPGHRLDLDPTMPTTIGRGPTNTIVLEDGRISTEHTKLTFHDKLWWVEDMDSRNKTFLNGNQVPVGQSVPARPGDLLVLGPMEGVVTFKFGA